MPRLLLCIAQWPLHNTYQPHLHSTYKPNVTVKCIEISVINVSKIEFLSADLNSHIQTCSLFERHKISTNLKIRNFSHSFQLLLQKSSHRVLNTISRGRKAHYQHHSSTWEPSNSAHHNDTQWHLNDAKKHVRSSRSKKNWYAKCGCTTA